MNTPVSPKLDKLLLDMGIDMPVSPTISDVVMWFYQKYNIWISVDPENDTDTWFYTISHNKSEIVFGNYSSPTEAYEKAIEHVLNNMIFDLVNRE